MNVQQLVPGTEGILPQYVLATCAPTITTYWVFVAFQRNVFAKDMPFNVAKAWVADLRHLLYDFEGYAGQS